MKEDIELSKTETIVATRARLCSVEIEFVRKDKPGHIEAWFAKIDGDDNEIPGWVGIQVILKDDEYAELMASNPTSMAKFSTLHEALLDVFVQFILKKGYISGTVVK